MIEKSPGRSFVINDGHVQWDSRPIWLNAERFQRETREHLARPLMEQDFTELARAMHWLAEHMGTNVHRYQDVKLAAEVDHGISQVISMFENRSVVQEKSLRDWPRAGQLANPWPAAWPVPCPEIISV